MNELTLLPIDGEPRIHDLLLAERLGFERPRDIRKLIKRHEEKLLNFGGCATAARVVEGNETSEFWLNQRQAIFICMKSETDKATDVQIEIVNVFNAYLNGDLKPVSKPAESTFQALSPHLRRDLQLEHTKQVSKALMELGGQDAIINYHVKNCEEQSGKHPQFWKKQGKAEGLPYRINKSAKEVLRLKNPPVACGMSFADEMVVGGASQEDAIDLGKQSQSLFKRMLELGIKPIEMLL